MGRSEHTFYLYALKNRRIQSKSNVKATAGRLHTQRVQLSAFSRAVLAVFKRSSKFPNHISKNAIYSKDKEFHTAGGCTKEPFSPTCFLSKGLSISICVFLVITYLKSFSSHLL